MIKQLTLLTFVIDSPVLKRIVCGLRHICLVLTRSIIEKDLLDVSRQFIDENYPLVDIAVASPQIGISDLFTVLFRQ